MQQEEKLLEERCRVYKRLESQIKESCIVVTKEKVRKLVDKYDTILDFFINWDVFLSNKGKKSEKLFSLKMKDSNYMYVTWGNYMIFRTGYVLHFNSPENEHISIGLIQSDLEKISSIFIDAIRFIRELCKELDLIYNTININYIDALFKIEEYFRHIKLKPQ